MGPGINWAWAQSIGPGRQAPYLPRGGGGGGLGPWAWTHILYYISARALGGSAGHARTFPEISRHSSFLASARAARGRMLAPGRSKVPIVLSTGLPARSKVPFGPARGCQGTRNYRSGLLRAPQGARKWVSVLLERSTERSKVLLERTFDATVRSEVLLARFLGGTASYRTFGIVPTCFF